jgi:hypothetical protein
LTETTKNLTSVKIQLGHLQGVRLALLLAEGEHNDRGKVSLHDHLDDLEAIAAILSPAAAPRSSSAFPRLATVGEDGHRLGEIVFPELTVLVDDLKMHKI